MPLSVRRLSATILCAALAIATARGGELIFRADDPLAREPETQDASKVQEWDIYLLIDLSLNLFGEPGDRDTGIRAANVNTIDEVPDSSWFTNRVLARPLSVADAARGPAASNVAPGPWTVIAAKEAGAAPGFTIRDSRGETWFISFDARGYPEAATAAIVVATRLFWALGYWQADNVLTSVRPEQVLLGDATVRTPSGRRRLMRARDLDEVWSRAHKSADGSFRVVASRRLPGRPLGGFRYHGTRPDDPNDVIPHEHRRELRALKVFGAWTNLVDIKAGNTLDVLVDTENGPRVRHYLQDVGSTFGTGATAPHEYFEGWEHVTETDLIWKRLVSLGFFIRPWQTFPYDERAAIGRFESAQFDPAEWKPRVPVAALRHAQPADLFWAARRVMAFSDEMIRAIVATGGYTSARDAEYLAATLMQRRDKIGAAYLLSVTPLVNAALAADGVLTFDNAAVQAGVAAPPRDGYTIAWSYFDNESGTLTPIGESVAAGGRAPAPAPLRDTPGTFVRTAVHLANPAGSVWNGATVTFRRATDRWELVGLDRRAR
jgi:hypothetical protein